MSTVRYTVIDGEVIAEKRNGVRREYVPDPLGSTVALLDNTQTVTDSFSYWPYGEEQARTGTTPTPFEFVGTMGYYKDSGSKTYVRARYLDVKAGRWMTQDPIGFWGGDVNLYRYVFDCPSSSIDPEGLQEPIIQPPFCPRQQPPHKWTLGPLDPLPPLEMPPGHHRKPPGWHFHFQPPWKPKVPKWFPPHLRFDPVDPWGGDVDIPFYSK